MLICPDICESLFNAWLKKYLQPPREFCKCRVISSKVKITASMTFILEYHINHSLWHIFQMSIFLA